MALYLAWWFIPGHVGNPWLYSLLLFGEFYHVIMALTFWHTIWPRRKQKAIIQPDSSFAPGVDIYIPVAGESVDVVAGTVNAAKNINYENKKIYILNDGYVANKTNWQEIEMLAYELGVDCITRKIPGGAKAGNINNALRRTKGEIIVLFDADMVPYSKFLQTVIPYFRDNNVAFVQTPQFYKNADRNTVTAGAWEQQAFFFGPVMQGKDKVNAAFICGTNVAIRRQVLDEVGGLAEDNIAEDFLTSLYIHKRKWKSHYLDEVLVEGLAPEDLQSYFNQQLRWARGSLEILFGQNVLFTRNLTVHQKIQYLSSALYYFNGVIMLIDMLMPLIFLLSGIQPVAATTTSFALFFIPFMVMNLYTLFLASDGTFTFRAISFSQSSWTLQLFAVVAVLFRMKTGFIVTPKQAQKGNFLYLTYPHIIYVLLTVVGLIFSVHREGINPSVVTNVAWALFNISMFLPFILASVNWQSIGKTESQPKLFELQNMYRQG